MIQANELRIGNYIYDDFNEVHIVEKIESEKYNEWNGSDPSLVVFSKIDDKYNGMYTCDIVSGIPLTEEWLLKFGFEILGILVVQNDFIRLLREDGLCYFHTALLKTEVKTVHQLQNLFYSLTGSELVLSSVPEATKPAL